MKKQVRHFAHISALTLCTFISSLMFPAKANAFILEVLGLGAVANEAINQAGDRADQAIRNARDAALSVVGATDEATEARLNQIDGIVDEAISELAGIPADAEQRILATLARVEASATTLQTQFFAEVRMAIREAHCAVRQTLLEDLQIALGGTGDFLGTGVITIRPPVPLDQPGICSAFPNLDRCSELVQFEVHANFESTALEVRQFILDNIASADDSTPAYAIVEGYHYLASLGQTTSCFAGSNQAHLNVWLQDNVRYGNLATDWIQYANPGR